MPVCPENPMSRVLLIVYVCATCCFDDLTTFYLVIYSQSWDAFLYTPSYVSWAADNEFGTATVAVTTASLTGEGGLEYCFMCFSLALIRIRLLSI